MRVCLAMCLNFPQFEPEVAYEPVAYKKKSVIVIIASYEKIYLNIGFKIFHYF